MVDHEQQRSLSWDAGESLDVDVSVIPSKSDAGDGA